MESQSRGCANLRDVPRLRYLRRVNRLIIIYDDSTIEPYNRKGL